jgi:hypothetical protein
MRIVRSSIVVWAAVGLFAGSAARAQDFSLLHQMPRGIQGLQFNIVDGRIALTCGQPLTYQTTSDDGRRKESINVNNENGLASLIYECTTSAEQIKVQFVSGSQHVLLSQAPQGNSSLVAVEYSQVANENISLTLGSSPKQQIFRAPNIWQLLIVQPDVCRQHLLPLLGALQPSWRLMETANLLEKHLLRLANSDSAPDRAHWAALVEQLADERFAKRQAAERLLRSGGGPALAYLRHLDFDGLSAEQQFRVQRIVEALTPPDGVDSPEQVARFLAAEPTVWLSLLGRPELPTRQTAAKQLVTLLGSPIPVDPDAAPDTQREKREQLRLRLGAE